MATFGHYLKYLNHQTIANQVKLEYLIIYKNDGTPIYARCFADMCKNAIGDPTLFSAFLSALSQFAEIDPLNLPTEMDLNGLPITVEYSENEGISDIKLEELELLFFYTKMQNITIAVGFNSDKYSRNEALPVFKNLISSIEIFLSDYLNYNWNNIPTTKLLEFENELLDQIIHPFFDQHDIHESCMLGESCPFRIAIYEEKTGNIFGKIKNKVLQYRKMNMIQKLKTKFFRSKYPLTT